MRFITFIFVILSSLSFQVIADDSGLSDPNQTLELLSTNTFARLNKEKERLKVESEYIKIIIEEELIPYFDYKYAAYSVLGPNLKKTTPEQRTEFLDEFYKYLINAYGHILLNYNQQTLTILGNKNFKNKKIVSIPVRMTESTGQVTQLSFKLRKNSKTGEWKVFDVIAEGVSMLNTKRSEFDSLIKKKGIDELINLLQKKNSEFSS